MIRNHGIVPKKGRSREEYYRTHMQHEPNYHLISSAICIVFIVGIVIGKLFF